MILSEGPRRLQGRGGEALRPRRGGHYNYYQYHLHISVIKAIH